MRYKRIPESLIIGLVGSSAGVAATAAVGLFVPWIHVTWLFAALAIPVNAVLSAAYSYHSRKPRLPVARLLP